MTDHRTAATARDAQAIAWAEHSLARNEAVAALFRLLPDSMFPESFDALMERVVAIEVIAATEAPGRVAALVEALRRWLRDDPWVPGAWSGTSIVQWECYACEATLTLPEHTYITPEDAGHIDGTGREARCLWLVTREALTPFQTRRFGMKPCQCIPFTPGGSDE